MVTPLTKVMDLTFLPGRGQYPPPRIFLPKQRLKI